MLWGTNITHVNFGNAILIEFTRAAHLPINMTNNTLNPLADSSISFTSMYVRPMNMELNFVEWKRFPFSAKVKMKFPISLSIWWRINENVSNCETKTVNVIHWSNGNNMWALILSLSRWEISRSMSNGCHTFRSIHIIVYSLNPCESYSTFSLSRNNFYHAIASKEKQASARRMQFCSTQWARMFAPRARLQLNEIIRVLLFSKSNVIKRFNVLPCQVSNRTIFAVLLLSISN